MEDEPVLHRHLHWIWKAFTDLNYRRGVSMSGACPISFADIEAYCSLKSIYSIFERQRLLHFLDVLDRHWMANHYKKQKSNEKDTRTTTDPRQFLKPKRTPRPTPRKRVS